MSGIVRYDDNWNLGDILILRNVDISGSPCIDFMAIQTWCRDLSLAVFDESANLFRLALRVLEHFRSRERLECCLRHLEQVEQGSWRRLTS